MLKPCPSRWFYGSELLIVIGLLTFAYYLELIKGIIPCPLCELQRIVFVFLGVFFLLGTFFQLNKLGHIILDGVISLISLIGVLLAARHVWLQYSPPTFNNPTCDASLSYLLKVMPISDVIGNILIGGPACAKVTWEFLHLNSAEWSLLWFVIFCWVSLWQWMSWIFSRSKMF